MASEEQRPTEAPSDLKERLKESYDAIAPVYNAWTVQHSERRLEWLDKLMALLPTAEPISILELGCGCGEPVISRLLTLPHVHITANDMSSTQISLAKATFAKEGNKITWAEGDMMSLSHSDASLDAVIGMYSIIHLPRDEQTQLLARIGRWLKPGGYLLANFSEEDKAHSMNERWYTKEDKSWMYWSGWGAEGSAKMAKDSGLEIVESAVTMDVVNSGFLWLIAKKM